MPINVLPKDSPRGRGPEPSNGESVTPTVAAKAEEDKGQETDLAAQEAQDLWESQEIGITSWSGEGGQRYSDPE